MVQPASPPLQTAPWIFWGNVSVGIGTTVALRHLEVPEKYYLPINMGVSIGVMSVLQWSRLVQGYSILEVGKKFPLIYGINYTLPFAMGGTLGKIPYLETFQAGREG